MKAMPVADAQQPGPPEGREARPNREPRPSILVAIDHPMMRALTSELLAREAACRVTGTEGGDLALAGAIDRDQPDLVILDTGEFPGCWPVALGRFPAERVIVIGPEPAGSYRAAARAGGAGAWISRDRVADDLLAEVCRLLGELSWSRPSAFTPGRPGWRRASVVDRSPAPRPARMAARASPATLTVTPRAPEGT